MSEDADDVALSRLLAYFALVYGGWCIGYFQPTLAVAVPLLVVGAVAVGVLMGISDACRPARG